MSVFQEVRAACAEVAERARSVRIVDAGIDALAGELSADKDPDPSVDPAHVRFGDDETTAAFVITMDAINFGSGYFPTLAKPSGKSGYFTIAEALETRFRSAGSYSATSLARMQAEDCAKLFGQSREADSPAFELMTLFAAALRDLGHLLSERHGARFLQLVSSAGGRASALVSELRRMPAYEDVATYGDLRVPLLKRAQITCSDLHVAFGGDGPGLFSDIAELTMFPDNLVPHTLRMLGALEYAPKLLAQIDSGELIDVGTPEEVEIRAVGLHAVELLVRACHERGAPLTAQEIDGRLWRRGQHPDVKSRPRHRTRCTYY